MFKKNGNVETNVGITSDDPIGSNYTNMLNEKINNLSIQHGFLNDSDVFKIHEKCILASEFIEY